MELRSVDRDLFTLLQEATRWSAEFDQLVASFMAQVVPDKAKARRVGTAISELGQKLKEILDALEFSRDFQAVENYLTSKCLAKRGKALDFRAVEQLMAWQGDGLLAFADGRPLKPMPTGIDPESVRAGDASSGASSNNMFELLPRVLPFTADAFDATGGQEALLLKGAFERLCEEHKQLVGLGETYGDFDPAGKEFYLGQLGQIAFRWEELIDNALLAGVPLDPTFRSTSEEQLRRSGLTADEYRELVEDVHDIFREQAIKEKGI